MTLSIIVAMSANRVIGKDNQLPWHISEDLKHFKEVTMDHPIIMGRKTFESIGKPLPGRDNIVLSKSPEFKAEGVSVFSSLEEALLKNPEEENFVIGGAEIYNLALPKADRLYITLIHQEFDGDAYFPKVELRTDFFPTDESPIQKSTKEGLPYQFLTFVRKKK